MMLPIPLTFDVSLGFKCGGRRGERKTVNGAVNLRKRPKEPAQRQGKSRLCNAGETSKSFNDKKTDAINISFEQHVMLDDDIELSAMAVALSQIGFVNAVHGTVTYG